MLSGKSYLGVTTDLWSAGIVLYSMLVGTLPFDDQEINSLYEHIKIGTFYIPSNLSLKCIDFLKQILHIDPEKRITIEK
jgi:serine/threonine protein kinase